MPFELMGMDILTDLKETVNGNQAYSGVDGLLYEVAGGICGTRSHGGNIGENHSDEDNVEAWSTRENNYG